MKKLLLGLIMAGLIPLVPVGAHAANPVWDEGKTVDSYAIDVYHSPSCGCCKDWITHLEQHNFSVNSIEMSDVAPIKQRLGVPTQGASCHTGVVNGLVVEGHVPAQDIKKVLSDKNADTRLLTVSGMPSGGPGMDMDGARKDDFKVYAVSHKNEVGVFAEYKNY